MALDAALRAPPPPEDGANVLFVLGEAGAGKTSLMVMLRLAHLTGRWAGGLDVVLRRLEDGGLEVNEPQRTILLLDGLDADPAAAGLEARLLEILKASRPFRQVLITCRTRFLLGASLGDLPPERRSRLEIAGWRCPLLHLAPFDADQSERYLQRRFPSSWTTRLRTSLSRTDPSTQAQARAALHKLKGLDGSPFWLAHIGSLAAKTPRSVEPWALYSALTDAWAQRVCADNEGTSPEGLLSLCAALARRLNVTGRRSLRPGEASRPGRRSLQLQPLLDLKAGPEHLLHQTADGALRFSHVGVQSFLAVRWALENSDASIGPRTDLMRDLMWSSVRLSGAEGLQKLRDAGLADTLTTELRGALLQRAALRGFDMRGADLSGADLRHADLRGVGLQGAVMQGVDLRGALLQGANLAGADLEGAEINPLNLEGALCDAETLWPEGLFLPDTLLYLGPGADLQRRDLRGANLRGANLQRANLRVGKLRGADLRGANLRGADLQRVNFQDAQLRSANLEGADLQRADLQDADLQGVDLLGADLRYAFLQGADLQGADLQGARLNSAKLQRGSLGGARLQWADLRKARLEGADLEGSDLEGALLEGAIYDAETRWPPGFNPDEVKAVPS